MIDKIVAVCYCTDSSQSEHLGGDTLDVLTIKGVALSKYGSCVKFADAMGWNRNKADRILNGKQDPSLKDIGRMVRRMNLPSDVIVPLFFGTMFTK